MSAQVDPYEAAPRSFKAFFKHVQKSSIESVLGDPHLIDLSRHPATEELAPKTQYGIRSVDAGPSTTSVQSILGVSQLRRSYNVYGLDGLPGILSANVQHELLSSLLHRDLATACHKTNIHFHHDLPYDALSLADPSLPHSRPGTFFGLPSSSDAEFKPKDASAHSTFGIESFLQRKLRWMTLGAQYDWSQKTYTDVSRPKFPEDIRNLINDMFPSIEPEAAIMNVYRSNDFLGLHRDVSEECSKPLISISLGCDGIFVVGLAETTDYEDRCYAIRVQSGDVIELKEQSRYAWHGLARTLPGTCPSFLHSWPVKEDERTDQNDCYEDWRGWLLDKRINLSVRQVHNKI